MFFSKKDLDVKEEAALSSQSEKLPPPPYEPQPLQQSDWTSPVPSLIPTPSTILTIQASGSGSCAMSHFSNDMTVPIFLGTEVYTQPRYISTRSRRRSNNAILSQTNTGDIVSTTYRWGCGKSREPKIQRLDGTDALTVSSSSWHRRATVTSQTNPTQALLWKYLKTTTAVKDNLKVLVLVASPAGSSSKSDQSEQILAVLYRPEMSVWRGGGGEGGQLIVSPEAAMYLDEPFLVSSCLMMLKKEVDRRADATNAAVAGAVAS